MSALKLESDLEFAIRLAKSAGKLLLNCANENTKTAPRETSAFVSDTVVTIDKLISDSVGENYPADGLLSSAGQNNLARPEKQRIWLASSVDSLADFKRYVESFGFDSEHEFFSINIGLTIDKEAVLGVVYVPIKNEMFFAVRGRGAYKVSHSAIPSPLFAQKLRGNPELGLGNSVYEHPKMRAFARLTEPRRKAFGNVFGYYLTAIADGQINAYATFPNDAKELTECTVCAPSTILEEAGGTITNFSGQKLTFGNPTPYFTNGIIAASSSRTLDLLK